MLSSPEQWRSPEIASAWDSLLRDTDNIDVLFQSPTWFDYLVETHSGAEPFVAVIRDDLGLAAGIVPIVVDDRPLRFEVACRSLLKPTLSVAFLLGSRPLVPSVPALCDEFFSAVANGNPTCDCLYLDSVPTDGFLWEYLHGSTVIRDRFLPYVPDGRRPYHLLRLPRTFHEYLSGLGSNTRRNAKRSLKRLRKHSGGSVKLEHVRTTDAVDPFLEDADRIMARSWKPARLGRRIENSEKFRKRLEKLAGSGLLRSYVLRSGETAVAFLVGYAFRGIYYGAETAYLRDFAEFSPGFAMFLLVIEDLIRSGGLRILNMGIGHAFYKEKLCNIHTEDASVYLFRRSLRNRLLRGSHALFRLAVRGVKSARRTIARGRRENG